jgi:hypothetical protein
MNRDDRLFTIIGGTVVTAAASVFLVFAGGITGSIESGSTVRVSPIPAAETPGPVDARPAPETLERPDAQPDVVYATRVEASSISGSDAFVSLVAGVSAHPGWAAWLVTDDLLYRFVAAVEAVADGYSPTDELGFMTTGGPFLVRKEEDRLVMAAGTFRRYNLAVEVLGSIEVDDAVAIFRKLEPEIEEVRGEVAWHRGDFEDRLRQAIDHLLAVEIPTGPVEVERRTASYAFADDRYETLSGAQRQLLRMGSTNANRVQNNLRNLRVAFGWPDAPNPHPVPEEPETPIMVADLAVKTRVSEVDAVGDSSMAEPVVTPFDPRIAGFQSPWLDPVPMITMPTETVMP